VAEPTVREIMDPDPPTVSPETDATTVIRTLRDNEVHGVPVVDGDGRCVGIVTEADLVIASDEGDLHLPHYLELFGGVVFIEPLRRFEDRLRKAFASKASDLMTPDPLTVSPDTPVREAAHKIVETGHNRLPVVEDGQLVGMVSRVDVLGALAR
jgi:CBS domain-containing protein